MSMYRIIGVAFPIWHMACLVIAISYPSSKGLGNHVKEEGGKEERKKNVRDDGLLTEQYCYYL